ncbi:MAG: hypothetical protein WCT41_03665 [Candidatus Paceibacterota bacterium]|jgi:hypothetical protein
MNQQYEKAFWVTFGGLVLTLNFTFVPIFAFIGSWSGTLVVLIMFSATFISVFSALLIAYSCTNGEEVTDLIRFSERILMYWNPIGLLWSAWAKVLLPVIALIRITYANIETPYKKDTKT